MMIESFSGILHSPGSRGPVLARSSCPSRAAPAPGGRMVPMSPASLFAGREKLLGGAVDLVLLVQVVVPSDRRQDRLGIELGVEHDPGESPFAEIVDQR